MKKLLSTTSVLAFLGLSLFTLEPACAVPPDEMEGIPTPVIVKAAQDMAEETEHRKLKAALAAHEKTYRKALKVFFTGSTPWVMLSGLINNLGTELNTRLPLSDKQKEALTQLNKTIEKIYAANVPFLKPNLFTEEEEFLKFYDHVDFSSANLDMSEKPLPEKYDVRFLLTLMNPTRNNPKDPRYAFNPLDMEFSYGIKVTQPGEHKAYDDLRTVFSMCTTDHVTPAGYDVLKSLKEICSGDAYETTFPEFPIKVGYTGEAAAAAEEPGEDKAAAAAGAS